MSQNWTFLPGILARGYRVASGPSQDYPYGALGVIKEPRDFCPGVLIF
jgi:hypothetical protein